MNGFGSPPEHQPVTWLRGYPIYAAHFVVAVLVASMLVTTVLLTAKAHGVLGWLAFSSPDVLRGEVWRLATYGLVNPPNLWFAIDMVMIVWFGREVERSVGRAGFLRLYGCLYLLSPLLLTVLGLWHPTSLVGQTGGFALFVAFATLYPDAPMLFNLLAKWVALILVGIFSLMALADRDWVRLATMWATCGFAFAYVQTAQGRLTWPKFKLRPRPSQARVTSDAKTRRVSAPRSVEQDAMAEVDALLDKIAQKGMASLTPKERDRLEAARATLRKRSGS